MRRRGGGGEGEREEEDNDINKEQQKRRMMTTDFVRMLHVPPKINPGGEDIWGSRAWCAAGRREL